MNLARVPFSPFIYANFHKLTHVIGNNSWFNDNYTKSLFPSEKVCQEIFSPFYFVQNGMWPKLVSSS